jgi:very-short-patch-repair endonuclease
MSIFRLSGELAFAELQARLTGDRPRPSPADLALERTAQKHAQPGSYAARMRPHYAAHIDALCKELRIDSPVYEHAFHAQRRWRFDCAWPAQMVALEIDGGAWSNGRHTRGQGFLNDLDKLNSAVLLGWKVLRFPPDNLLNAMTSIRLLLLNGGK